MAGRGRRAERRWLLSSEGLEELFSVDHTHVLARPYGHVHDPLSPRTSGHEHVPWWLGEAGAKEQYGRVEQLPPYYEVALRLFREAGSEWLRYVPGEPVLTRWVFLRRGKLAEAAATFETGDKKYNVIFCWLGKQLKTNRMVEKWRARFKDLDFCADGGEAVRYSGSFFEDGWPVERDPKYDPAPQPSCYVFIGADEFAVREAMAHLPLLGYLGENACSWWVAGKPCWKVGESGVVYPDGDLVWDPFEDIRVGEPERVASPTGNGGRDVPPWPAVDFQGL